VRVGEPLYDFHGVMSGIPAFAKGDESPIARR